MVRLGAIDNPPKTPAILGFECAGEIEAVGDGVEDFKVHLNKIKDFSKQGFARDLSDLFFKVGDRVVALPEYQAWAELCAVSTKYVYKLPDDISFHDAAAMTLNYLVAYIIVNDLILLRQGKSVMLHSAGGGVVRTVKFYLEINTSVFLYADLICMLNLFVLGTCYRTIGKDL